MGTVDNKLEYLMDTKSSIKNAIEQKDVTVLSTTPFRDYADKILEIQTGVDTTDATATPNDITFNKTAYVQEQKITGTLLEGKDVTYISDSIITSHNGLDYLLYNFPSDKIQRENSGIAIEFNKSDVGIAGGLTTDKLVDGSTAFGITGTAPNVNNQTLGSSSDFLKGTYAYINGKLVEGNINKYESDSGTTFMNRTWEIVQDQSITDESYHGPAVVEKMYPASNLLFMSNGSNYISAITYFVKLQELEPNLKAENIKKGVTIYGVTGTYVG